MRLTEEEQVENAIVKYVKLEGYRDRRKLRRSVLQHAEFPNYDQELDSSKLPEMVTETPVKFERVAVAGSTSASGEKDKGEESSRKMMLLMLQRRTEQQKQVFRCTECNKKIVGKKEAVEHHVAAGPCVRDTENQLDDSTVYQCKNCSEVCRSIKHIVYYKYVYL